MSGSILVLRAVLSALLACALAGWLSRGLGAWGWLDQPNARSSHVRPTPRGGGLAFVLPAVFLAPSPLLLIPLPLALVGLLDDRRGLPVRLRLLVQLLTGVALALAAGWSLPGALLVAVPAVALINAVNFMDGLDGLVASCLALWLALAALLLPAGSLWMLAAAVLGFLVWNWSPARLFSGVAAAAGRCLQLPVAASAGRSAVVAGPSSAPVPAIATGRLEPPPRCGVVCRRHRLAGSGGCSARGCAAGWVPGVRPRGDGRRRCRRAAAGLLA